MTNKNILIIGSSGGIGKAFVDIFAKQNTDNKIIGLSRSETTTFDEQQHELEETLKTCTNENDIILLNALKEYYNLFSNQLTTTV